MHLIFWQNDFILFNIYTIYLLNSSLYLFPYDLSTLPNPTPLVSTHHLLSLSLVILSSEIAIMSEAQCNSFKFIM